MNNYSKVLTFFMENNVQLTQEQIEALQEEFLLEKKEKNPREVFMKESIKAIEQAFKDIRSPLKGFGYTAKVVNKEEFTSGKTDTIEYVTSFAQFARTYQDMENFKSRLNHAAKRFIPKVKEIAEDNNISNIEFTHDNGTILIKIKDNNKTVNESYLNEAAIDPVKSDFNKFKKAWSFNTPAIVIKFEADCYDDEDMYNFGGYDVHDYPAFKKLKSDASRDELVQVVNNDFYAKFEKAIEKVNKVISGTAEIEGDWDTGNIVYRK